MQDSYQNYINFISLVDQRRGIINRKYDLITKYDNFIKQRNLKIWAKYNKKKKFRWETAKDLPEIKEFQDRIKVISDRFFQYWNDKINHVDSVLNSLSGELEIAKKENPILYHTTYTTTYNSQGFGANKYSRNAAEMYLLKAKLYGIDGEIREVLEFKGEYQDYFRFEVWIKTDEIGTEILRRKEEPPIKEVFRFLLKNGTSPYVYYPFASDRNLIEELGLDWYGNDIIK